MQAQIYTTPPLLRIDKAPQKENLLTASSAIHAIFAFQRVYNIN